MPRSRKINREKVMASLNRICPKCGFKITPDLVSPSVAGTVSYPEQSRLSGLKAASSRRMLQSDLGLKRSRDLIYSLGVTTLDNKLIPLTAILACHGFRAPLALRIDDQR
jgi:hypothetical protein